MSADSPSSSSPKSKQGAIQKPLGRKRKDPYAPRRGVSAYMFFANENRDRIREENPGFKFGEVGKALGDAWKSLSEKQKQPYEELAYKDKVRYEKQKAKYRTELESDEEAESRSKDEAGHDRELEFMPLFEKRPSGLLAKSAWLRNLEKEYGKTWYDEFFTWYQNKLYRPEPSWHNVSIVDIRRIIDSAPWMMWHPKEILTRRITYYLAHAPVSTTPDIYIGQYNGYSLGLILNGAALNPRQVEVETFQALDVKYAHLPMFVGLRMEDCETDLCALTLGNVYASKDGLVSEGVEWFDTHFVLAMNVSGEWKKRRHLLIHQYSTVNTDFPDNQGEDQAEALESEETPQFCGGQAAFTVARCDVNAGLSLLRHNEDALGASGADSSSLTDLELTVRSVKRPDLVVAGFVSDETPYLPVFPPEGD